MTDIVVTVRDVNDVRHVLAACQNYFAALDLAERYRHLTDSEAESAIYKEIKRSRDRFDAYMGDYLLQQQEEEAEAEEEEVEDEEEVEEEPSGTPLGSFEVPRQQGRRVSAQELRERAVEDEG